MKNILEQIHDLYTRTENDWVLQAKNAGTPVIGFLCSYIPEEILAAAGVFPYRLRGVNSGGTQLADAHYSSKNCSFPKNVLNKILRGDFHFLDGIVFMNGCDHTRRMYDILRHSNPHLFRWMPFVDVPQVLGPSHIDRYAGILRGFREQLEAFLGRTIAAEALVGAIRVGNRKRRLLREVHDLRKDERLQVKGSDVLKLMLCVTAMPAAEAIPLIEAFLAYQRSRPAQPVSATRLILAGGCLEDVGHVEMIESLGGRIVADNTCLGYRSASIEIEEEGDPIDNVARGYLQHLSCARMVNLYRQRLAFIESARKEFNAEGLIFEKLAFCVLYGGDMFIYKNEMKKWNFPMLALEKTYEDPDSGQLKTRVQAFLEELSNRRRQASSE